MLRFIFFTVVSFLFGLFATKLFDYAIDNKPKKEIEFLVTAPHGIIGCLSKGKFIEEQQYINKGNYQAAQQQLDDEVCFYFEKGSKMFANEGTCSKNFKNDYLTNFKPNGFALLQVYLPCYSVR